MTIAQNEHKNEQTGTKRHKGKEIKKDKDTQNNKTGWQKAKTKITFKTKEEN